MRYDFPRRLEENRCFCCGHANPHGLQLEFEREGDELRCRLTPDARWCGFARVVHGGIQTAILDEVAVWAVAALRERMAMTAGLNVRYLKPVWVGAPLVGAARIVAASDGRYQVRSELRGEDGSVRTEADCELHVMREAFFRRFTGLREVPPIWRPLIQK